MMAIPSKFQFSANDKDKKNRSLLYNQYFEAIRQKI